MKDAQKQKSIIAIAFFGAILLTLAGGTWYLYKTMNGINSEIQTIKSEIASIESENNVIRDFQQLLTKREPDISRIRALFIEADRPLRFIEAIESLGRTTKNSITLDAQNPKPDSQYFIFRVTAEGKKQNVFQFLTLLEHAPYEITVRSYTLTAVSEIDPADPESQRMRLALALEVKTK
ncbi:MAG: hypothetical protein A2847_00305 [Candidatus Sungbacteria bacterium RIFCSPHIGHO2_01_FULL_50_25]|uniref:Uncharacterized protein n=1 Tax=Candidatus Sungbacteria bacterium RIFCSPHIGHO2_01_FULL_50_25 TaxID=1802265 RepID=A0A1G2KAR7_9BACT|nr:MAG: hypothetical protein A2847_00305 [Candidatus Sungbacteria bacterium RIFCSPHIGHO2_01_FULL_50_25]